MIPHSAASHRPAIRSYRVSDSGEPPYDFTMRPANLNQSGPELAPSRRGDLDVSNLHQSRSLPSINSILHGELTQISSTRPHTRHSHELPIQRMSFPLCQAAITRFWGHQSVPAGSLWSQAPQFQMPNWNGRIEQSQRISESNSANQRVDLPQVNVLRCEYLDPLTGHACASSFSRHDCLLRHKRTVHTPGKPKWQCRLCDGHRSFTRHDSLARHMRQIHGVFDFPGKQRSSI